MKRYPLFPSAIAVSGQYMDVAITGRVRLAVLQHCYRVCLRILQHWCYMCLRNVLRRACVQSLMQRRQPIGDDCIVVGRQRRRINGFRFTNTVLQLLAIGVSLLHLNDIDAGSFAKTHRRSDFGPPAQRLLFLLALKSHVFVAHLWVAGVLAQGVRLPETPAAGVTADVELAEVTALEVMPVVHVLVEQPIA